MFAAAFVFSGLTAAVFFQNCSGSGGGGGGGRRVRTTFVCEFNGHTVASNASVTAYQNSTVPHGTNCVSETRTCQRGALTGSYAYASCSVAAPAACLFNGQTIGHSSSATAFQNSSVAHGHQCASETRVCSNGVLSGSFSYGNCQVDAPSSCLFNGVTIAHDSSVTAFTGSTVPYGSSCVEEERVCNNGVLSGSFIYASCNVDAPASCLFDGQTIAHGQTVTSFQNSTVSYGNTCAQEIRVCDNGTLSGSYQYASCNVDAPASCQFDGQTIAHGESVNAFLQSTVAFGGACTSQARVCNNGVLSGTYSYSLCNIDSPASCQFDGQTIAHGASIEAFQTSSVPYGLICASQTRACYNGILSGSYSYGTCNPGAPASCLFNGQTVAHGESVMAFRNSAVAFGSSCAAEQRVCDNGSLSGSHQYASCEVNNPASCLFNGQTIAHGAEVTGYETSSVPFGNACIAQARLCNDGVLSGTEEFASCEVGAPASCLFNGQTVAHGDSVVSYATSSVSFGSSCAPQNRTCDNGNLSGSFTFASCNVGAPASCLFNGQTVAHGSSVAAFQSSSVSYGNTCTQEQRGCNNGTLSGSFQHGACAVDNPASCNFNNQSIAHGSGVIAYQSAKVAYGQSCASENRSCNNGTLGGSYTNASCSVEAPANCAFNDQAVVHGESVTAYLASSAATCTQESRSCNNGTLSGSYQYASCTSTAGGCTFDGRTILNGSSVTAWRNATSPPTCTSQTRTCTNGTLSGTYQFGSCR